jgi:hypothetical protein
MQTFAEILARIKANLPDEPPPVPAPTLPMPTDDELPPQPYQDAEKETQP